MIQPVLISFLFLFNFLAASNLSNFNFRKGLNDLKLALNSNGNIAPILDDFNKETARFYSSETIRISVEIHREYISIKEEIICLLYNDYLTDFKLDEIDVFNSLLFVELKKFDIFFSLDTLHIVLSFLIKASSRRVHDHKKVKEFAAKLAVKLSPLQYQEFLKSLILDFKSSESSDIDSKIEEISNSFDQDQIFLIIREASNKINENIQVKSYEILATKLEIIDFDVHPDWLVPIIKTLSILFSRNIESSMFSLLVGHFVFSEKIVNIMKNSSFNQSYALLLYFVLKNQEIIKLYAGYIFPQIRESPYAFTFGTSLALIQNIQIISSNLNDNSSEDDFKRVVDPFDTLILLKNSNRNQFAKQVLSADFDYISSFVSKIENILMNEKHPLNALGMKIVGIIGYLCHDLSESEEKISISYSSIVSGYGTYLIKNEPNSCEHVNRFIHDFQPKIAIALEYLLKNFNNIYFQAFILKAAIRFALLIPDVRVSRSFIDRFCSNFISNSVSNYNRYETIKDIEIADEKGVYISSFLTFLERYVILPDESQLPYLRDFYSFLKDSKLLSKTELIILERNFNGFRQISKRFKRAK
jgi:hypothetical protein